MSLYVSSFTLPVEREEELVIRRMRHNGGALGYIDNYYPCCIFDKKQLRTIEFAPITFFCGGNGSGKSTLLNLIAEKLRLYRSAPFNSGELFASYAENCSYTAACGDDGEELKVPEGSSIITSDDVFDFMLAARTNNEEIAEETEAGRDKYARLKFGETIRFSGMDDYEVVRQQLLARSKSVSRRKFLRRTVGSEVRMGSNGETALEYFDAKLRSDALYCLDEPENSMSVKMQLALADLLAQSARYCGCQLIIATHSPILLALEGARIYDLDASPAAVRDWRELENVRLLSDFFKKHSSRFR